jgi:uncharacterized protein (DUF3820 family)
MANARVRIRDDNRTRNESRRDGPSIPENAPTPGHVCHAEGCNVSTEPRMLFCLKHWRMVPASIQRAVWREYRPGQERDKKPSAEYLVVARQAIEAVKTAEWRLRTGIGTTIGTPERYSPSEGRWRSSGEPTRYRHDGPERVYKSIPFGKHKGEPLEELPLSYLQWFITNVEDDGSGLYSSVQQELWDRGCQDAVEALEDDDE